MIPLLHVAQAAAEAATVDRPTVASALAAFAAGVAALWRPKGTLLPLGGRRSRRRLVAGIAGVAMFLAALPLVIPIDHIVVTHAETPGHDEIHTAHCHNEPGSCSELPVASGPGQFMASAPLIIAPAFVAVLLLALFPVMYGWWPQPEVRPPLRAAAAV